MRKIKKAARLIPCSRTKDFRSRIVVLKPRQGIGWHSTKNHEELIIVVEGRVEATDCRRRAKAAAPSAILIPRHTRHNIENNSGKPAKYVYVIPRKAYGKPRKFGTF